MNVLLSVGREGDWRDLELPAQRPLEELLPILGALIGGGEATGEWELLAAPPIRRLEPGQTLAEAGVWTGSWLLVRPRLDSSP
ncbi:MAG TPA: EsaB/YukD family protein [Symbiobacteriaceae bacterium]|nr:EsaB/YukD family protein [Symbiobacteriaceae bacterium]